MSDLSHHVNVSYDEGEDSRGNLFAFESSFAMLLIALAPLVAVAIVAIFGISLALSAELQCPAERPLKRVVEQWPQLMCAMAFCPTALVCPKIAGIPCQYVPQGCSKCGPTIADSCFTEDEIKKATIQ